MVPKKRAILDAPLADLEHGKVATRLLSDDAPSCRRGEAGVKERPRCLRHCRYPRIRCARPRLDPGAAVTRVDDYQAGNHRMLLAPDPAPCSLLLPLLIALLCSCSWALRRRR